MGGPQICGFVPEEETLAYKSENTQASTRDIFSKLAGGIDVMNLEDEEDLKADCVNRIQTKSAEAEIKAKNGATQEVPTEAAEHSSGIFESVVHSYEEVSQLSGQAACSSSVFKSPKFSANEQHELMDQLDQLSLVFPNITLRNIKVILEKARGDMEEAMDMCLNYDFLKPQLDEEISSSNWTRLEQNKLAYIEKKSNKKKIHKDGQSCDTSNDINALQCHFEKIDQVQELLDLQDADNELVGHFLQRNDQDVSSTVSDILVNWRPQESFEKQGMHSPTECVIKKLTALSYAESVEQTSRGKSWNNFLETCGDTQLQTVWPELVLNIKSNSKLQLPFTFYLNSLIWFGYDVPKVLTLAYRLATEFNMKLVEATFEKDHIKKEILKNIKFDSPLREQSKETYADIAKLKKGVTNVWTREDHLRTKIKNKAYQISNEKNNLVKGVYSTQLTTLNGKLNNLQDMEQRKVVDSMKRQAAATDIIDLHGLSVKYALLLVGEALTEWWECEISMRVERGGKVNSTKAMHVNPFTIVTGRGVHSAGNIPKIKNSVKGKLVADSWIFDELSSEFVVVGSRSR